MGTLVNTATGLTNMSPTIRKQTMSNNDDLAKVGLIGLAVMGQNLALNIADNGYSIAVYNRTTETTTKFAAQASDSQDVRACLLYTSPSPRDRTRSRMPSSA